MPQFDVRGDYAFSDKDRFFVRSSYAHRKYTAPSPGTVFMNGGNAYGNNSSFNDVVGWNHFFNSNMINEARIGFSRYYTVDFNNAYGIEENNLLGIPNGQHFDACRLPAVLHNSISRISAVRATLVGCPTDWVDWRIFSSTWTRCR